MLTFFSYENHSFPPSLSEYGELRSSKKSDLLALLGHNNCADPPNSFDTIVLDGGALVHLLTTVNITTFDQYADDVVIPHILKQLERSTRVDIVWDTYITDSLKQSTRDRRGKGTRKKVAGKNKVPGKWNDFLRDETNKKELFHFLSKKIVSANYPEGKQVYITSGTEVFLKGSDQQMQACDHEEADTRLVVHIVHAIHNGHGKILVRTVDTDVIVILVGKFFYLLSLNSDISIWVAFGKGKSFSYWHINSICTFLGEEKALGLPVFHSLTGSDTTSGFFGKSLQSSLFW